ncbi:MAG: HAD family hydrolase [Clostridiales bacterium]|nr:MAG: HAD family hydrolase [Clostridiales bacterium]
MKIDLKKYHAVIFDLDGTLVDSMWIWKDIDIEYLLKHNCQFPANLQSEIEGMSTTEVALYFKERFNIKDDVAAIKAEWLDMARDYYASRIGLKKGVRSFLEKLVGENIKMAIGTSNFKDLATLVLQSNQIDHYFGTLRTACEFERGKPHPDIFLGVAAELDVKPQHCLVFEDTRAGVQAARSAGMDVIAIADDLSRPYRAELAREALYYLEDFTPLL